MPVTLVERYNPQWPSWFDAIKEWLGADLRAACIRIEHAGSTSIPGMIAKPIIDLILVIERTDFNRVKSLLEARGYRWEGDLGIFDRQAFKVPDEKLRQRLPSHHLYVCPRDSEQLKRQLAFREFLKTSPEYAERLSALKWSLAERFNNDREAYMAGKDALCKEIIEKALALGEPQCLDNAPRYYDALAPLYDEKAGYLEPEAEVLREAAKARYRNVFRHRRVLEIACGTGYWTKVIAETAQSVLATDINASMLSQARGSCRGLSNVQFQEADAYSLDGLPVGFDAAFANHWWSHMPRSRIPAFLAALHSKLSPGAIVLIADQLPIELGFSVEQDSEGNRIELRPTPDGTALGVIKNFPTEVEIRDCIEGLAQDIRYLERDGVWNVLYHV